MSTIYEQALASLTKSIIEQYLPGGNWRGIEYWINNPLRSDDEQATNFSINLNTGQYYDLATGDKGNLITLIEAITSKKRHEIAREILSMAGRANNSFEFMPNQHQKNTEALSIDDIFLPIPAAHIESFNRQLSAAIYKRRQRGVECLAQHAYYDEKSNLLCVIARWQEFDQAKNRYKKHMTPHYLQKNGKVAWKQALEDNRPLYNLHQLAQNTQLPVLIVEGEKCADIVVPGYVVTTWMGGARAIALANWAILTDRQVIIWPDHDEPGQSAALSIRKILPQAQILPIENTRPKGWDIADAVQDEANFDVVAYIQARIEALKPKESGSVEGFSRRLRNFICVGYTDNEWVFYLRRTRRLYYLRNTGITSQHLLHLEDLEWWEIEGYVSAKGTFFMNNILNDIKKEIERCGLFDYAHSTGFGFYHIEDKFYWHDGAKIIDQSGQLLALDSMLPKHIFTEEKSSSHPFYTYYSESLSTDARFHIFNYFCMRNWRFNEHNFSARLALGWALWSPFCAFFEWRPHLHITAAAGTGKSTLIDYGIKPLVAPYAMCYSNLTSPAAIRQAVNRKPRGVILEEFEATGKDDKMANNIDGIYELIKAASDNNSAKAIKGVPNADAQGRQTPREYETRATFLLVSIREATQDAALTQRIINLELTKRPMIDEKFLSDERYALKAMKEEAKFVVSECFRELPYLIEQTKSFARLLSTGHNIDDRMAKNFAPLLVFTHFFLFKKEDSILNDVENYAQYIKNYLASLSTEKVMSDAEKCLDIILQTDVINSDGERKSAYKIIKDLLRLSEFPESDLPLRLEDHLSRLGLLILNINKPTERQLAIHTNNEAIRQALRNSSYGKSYASILRRHEACVNEKYRSQSKAALAAAQNIAGVKPQFICLELSKIIETEES